MNACQVQSDSVWLILITVTEQLQGRQAGRHAGQQQSQGRWQQTGRPTPSVANTLIIPPQFCWFCRPYRGALHSTISWLLNFPVLMSHDTMLLPRNTADEQGTDNPFNYSSVKEVFSIGHAFKFAAQAGSTGNMTDDEAGCDLEWVQDLLRGSI